ncbi:MAG TPA: amidase [bacterium]|nr:amidase [bacterium]
MKSIRIIGYWFLFLCFTNPLFAQNDPDSVKIPMESVGAAEEILGLQFTPEERDSLLKDLKSYLHYYRTMRSLNLSNDVSPALVFDPTPPAALFSGQQQPVVYSEPQHTEVPEDIGELAYYSVRDLGELLRTQRIRSVELTRMYLDRLQRYGDTLECVITLLEDRALAQAAKADSEIAAGSYRGPLHGIPYGIKDLFAVQGARTTWGAMPYKDQVIHRDATVVKKLQDAGAVLVAKLTLGALAWGDVWYGGTTRNPWNPEQGSSGSSAGSAAATAAGLVPFAIGTETWGSIVSPSDRCGTTGLRPTFGRVSRTGAMALSWSMDKIGPIARSVEDCAIIFDAIRGPDGVDRSVKDVPFNYTPDIQLNQIKVGYASALFEEDYPTREFDLRTLDRLRSLGVELHAIDLPDTPVEPLSIILGVEAAAAFEELTLSDSDDLMVRQIRNAWPNVFRASRFIPAVEYIQANRIRSLLIEQMAAVMKDIDVFVTPSFGGDQMLLTNLTGHPCVVLPNGFREEGTPASISFIGQLYDEATVLAFARVYQEATDYHLQHPPLFP